MKNISRRKFLISGFTLGSTAPFVINANGGIWAPNIDSSLISKESFWLKIANEHELPVHIANFDTGFQFQLPTTVNQAYQKYLKILQLKKNTSQSSRLALNQIAEKTGLKSSQLILNKNLEGGFGLVSSLLNNPSNGKVVISNIDSNQSQISLKGSNEKGVVELNFTADDTVSDIVNKYTEILESDSNISTVLISDFNHLNYSHHEYMTLIKLAKSNGKKVILAISSFLVEDFKFIHKYDVDAVVIDVNRWTVTPYGFSLVYYSDSYNIPTNKEFSDLDNSSIAGALTLPLSIDYIQGIGRKLIKARIEYLNQVLTSKLESKKFIRIGSDDKALKLKPIGKNMSSEVIHEDLLSKNRILTALNRDYISIHFAPYVSAQQVSTLSSILTRA